MARQSTTPIKFNRTVRKDDSLLMTSGRAARVVPVAYAPLLPGDSASGKVGIDIELRDMPRPLLNAVHANVQAWFVPKTAFPQFAGRDELMHSFTGEKIKALGQADRNPPKYFFTANSTANRAIVNKSMMFKTLGIHCVDNQPINCDLIDAFILIYNFRLAAHTSKLKRRPYAAENLDVATDLPRAFWPSGRFASVVPDYERALVLGALDLDVLAGRMPVVGFGNSNGGTKGVYKSSIKVRDSRGFNVTYPKWMNVDETNQGMVVNMTDTGIPRIFAEMTGKRMTTTLADIDMARKTQAFAKMRTAYAGNDPTGFVNDDVIIAHLMQGLEVPEEQFKRPWLLDSRRVPIGFAERFATDAANLSKSVTRGRASAQLSINIPQQETGGMFIVTVEVLPERIYERSSDPFLHMDTPDDLPNALRDVQRVEPVDLVENSRIDARHTKPKGLYGYEPMNMKWNRDYTRLGGVFYSPKPGSGWKEARSAIWQTELVDPKFTESHFLAPINFPHDVFSDKRGPAFECVCRHSLSIVGLTQIGDVLVENSDDYKAVEQA
ncbi:MAG: hypothetical protein Q4G22_05895 [Paracoccus sp. (in: a-proteobacteria)]|uniref:hypothetical protein n=1 Tax=Paracoccus sp. TaxID=267 RepID=UPI0026E07A03|nr:hypothetical protein [Paracoccus sp. (in: a-proteobacteria)]MDO5631356.1 hypothetical protein [Paracoccus sp. (in: a-proteobacteria)]